MKKWLFAILGLVVLLPATALAADFRTDQKQVTVGSTETINNDLYAASGDVTVSSNVNGDAVIAGGTVKVDGKINGDLFVAGGTVNLSSEVTHSVRVTGGTVDIDGTIDGDLMIAGGTLSFGQQSVVKGQVYIAGGNVVMAGQTGTVKAALGSLELTKTAVVNGDLIYRANQVATIDSNAKIAGTTKYTELKNRRSVLVAAGLGTVFGFFWWLGAFIFAGLFTVLLPRKTALLVKNWRSEFWPNLLTGFLFIVAAPIAAFVVGITILGLPLAAGLVMLATVLSFFAKLLTILVIGCWIQRLWNKEKADQPNWPVALVGAIVLAAVAAVPVIGSAALFIAGLVSLGALIRLDWSLLKKIRQNEDLYLN